jgi:chromosome segregation ATPase
MLDWLTNTLEGIDQKAADSASAPLIDSVDEDPGSSLSSLELNALRSNVRRSNSKIASLEDQLSKLEQLKAHFENELSLCQVRNGQLSEANQQFELEVTKLRTALKNSERKQAQEKAAFEKAHQSSEELRERMQKEISALGHELSSTQHELSVTSHDLEKLRNESSAQQEDVRKLENEIGKYRERAVESLTIDTQDRTVLAQLEVLESERNRLKDSLAKSQQRISQQDAAAREHEEQMHREMGEAKQQQTQLETDLFRSRTQIEAMTHEIALLRGELATSHEAIESRYKAQIAAERNDHKAEIARLKSQFTNGVKGGHSSDEQLLNALATIDSLKCEKAALLVRLQSQRSGGDPGLMMSVNVDGRSTRTLGSLNSGTQKKGSQRGIGRAEALFRRSVNFVGRRPLLQVVLVLWIVVLHILYLDRLFR